MTVVHRRVVVDFDLCDEEDGGFLDGVLQDLGEAIARNNLDDIVDSWDAGIVDVTEAEPVIVAGGPDGFTFWRPLLPRGRGVEDIDSDLISRRLGGDSWWIMLLEPLDLES